VIRPLTTYLLISILSLVGIVTLIGNYALIIRCYALRKRGSLIPVLGGLSLGAATLLYPSRQVKPYAWIPLFVDPGCFFTLAGGLLSALRPRRVG
jgi:hypothetical protein